MPAADFAAAQERIAARRAQRAALARSHQLESPPPPHALARLPFPFNRLSAAGLSAWDAVKGREGTRPEFRVGQVDAELLDDELLELLKGQVGEGLKHLGSHLADTYRAEILLALRAVLFKLSIWNNNASYGAHLQGLRYTDARSPALTRPPPKPWQKVAYGLITVGGRYAWTKWEDHLVAASEDYTRPANPRLAQLTRLTEALSNAHDLASLASFLVFLVNGRYRTLTDRLLRLRLTPSSHTTSREVSFEYLNRQLVWHAFTEFLLFLLPLVGISRWRRILSRTLRRLRSSLLSLIGRRPSHSPDSADDDEQNTGELAFLPQRTCAICYRDQNPSSTSEAEALTQSAAGGGVVGSAATDITNPYMAECECVYCFACLAQRIASEEGEGWTCLRCGSLVKSCAPWDGDVLPPKTTKTSKQSTLPSQQRVRRSSGSGNAGGHGKSVLFAQPDTESRSHSGFHSDSDDHDHGHDMDEHLDHIPPMPYSDHETSSSAVPDDALLEKTRGLDLGQSLAFSERDEWARESGLGEEDEDEDEQSEEYDEDEEQEGEELEDGEGDFDYEGQ